MNNKLGAGAECLCNQSLQVAKDWNMLIIKPHCKIKALWNKKYQ